MTSNTAKSIMSDATKAEYEAKYGTDVKKLRKDADIAKKVDAIITNTKLTSVPTSYSAEALEAINATMSTHGDVSHLTFVEEIYTVFSAALEVLASHDPGEVTADRKCGWDTADIIGNWVYSRDRAVRGNQEQIDLLNKELDELDSAYLASESEVLANQIQKKEYFLDQKKAQRDYNQNLLDAFQKVHARFVGKPWTPYVAPANPGKDALKARIAARKARQ